MKAKYLNRAFGTDAIFSKLKPKVVFKTIGLRLIAAFTFIALMVLLVSLVAITTWNMLQNQVDMMIDNNIPTLKGSYQLERSSSKLQSNLNEVYSTPNLIRSSQLKIILYKDLDEINKITQTFYKSKDTRSLETEYIFLNKNISEYTALIEANLKLKLQLKKHLENILWIHQDIVEELNPLRQEMQWQITHEQKTRDPNIQNYLNSNFTILQNLTIEENELISLVQEIIRNYEKNNLHSAFQFIEYKTNEIQNLANEFADNTASITYRQLLHSLILVVKPKGKLHQTLEELTSISKQITIQKSLIELSLYNQQELIKTIVTKASKELSTIKSDAKKTVYIGNLGLFLVLFIALISSLFICVYFVQKKIVARLHGLSLSLNSVTEGKIDFPISLSGNDEIGKISTALKDFCQQMQELEKTNALNLINNTKASLITCSTDGYIESMNSSSTELFLADSDTGRERLIWDLFKPSQHKIIKEMFLETSPLLQGGASNITIEGTSNNLLTSYFRLDFRTYYQNNLKKVIITLNDITELENQARLLELKVQEKTMSLTRTNQFLSEEIEERKLAQQKLISTQDELIQTAKMAILGQAMTSLAHELNQPLSALGTYIFTVLMTHSSQKDPELISTMNKMSDICNRMDLIISNLRNFSKKSRADSSKIVDLKKSVKHAIDIVSSKARQLNIKVKDHLPRQSVCLGDQTQIEQVLVNLFMNSFDALAPIVNNQLRVDIYLLNKTGSHITIACCDNGTGFAENIVFDLFKAFTTTKEVGLGLGLNISRSIMKKINGTISLASTIEGGAMVVLEFQANADHKNLISGAPNVK